jgi:hypothetical protein
LDEAQEALDECGGAPDLDQHATYNLCRSRDGRHINQRLIVSLLTVKGADSNVRSC